MGGSGKSDSGKGESGHSGSGNRDSGKSLERALVERLANPRVMTKAWEALRIAWAYEEIDDPESAEEWRTDALELLLEAEGASGRFARGPGARNAVLAELMRRSRRFAEAERRARNGLAGRPRGFVRSALELILELAVARDADPHLAAELGPGGGRGRGAR